MEHIPHRIRKVSLLLRCRRSMGSSTMARIGDLEVSSHLLQLACLCNAKPGFDLPGLDLCISIIWTARLPLFVHLKRFCLAFQVVTRVQLGYLYLCHASAPHGGQEVKLYRSVDLNTGHSAFLQRRQNGRQEETQPRARAAQARSAGADRGSSSPWCQGEPALDCYRAFHFMHTKCKTLTDCCRRGRAKRSSAQRLRMMRKRWVHWEQAISSCRHTHASEPHDLKQQAFRLCLCTLPCQMCVGTS